MRSLKESGTCEDNVAQEAGFGHMRTRGFWRLGRCLVAARPKKPLAAALCGLCRSPCYAKFSFRSNAVLGGFGSGDRADDHARAADALSVF
jgi:hypothetical protein